jgi:hypothetical protein
MRNANPLPRQNPPTPHPRHPIPYHRPEKKTQIADWANMTAVLPIISI